ncbi:hypothetical protein FGO68_gene12291 [Halteria grandinella]|uniref:TLDc domain-containing protein n=1 Tax=Halteria grandinella TaxID=5974 RepID=A0A8J8NS53_HALGN|nr:hypothetical protein FGO68_gene12291 [Halteria grandinella]
MEELIDQSNTNHQEVYKYKLGKIKSKYLIILILCGSDQLDNCLPQFSKSCKAFKNLYYEHGMYFIRNGASLWQKLAIPKDPNSLIKTEQDIKLIYQGLKQRKFKLEKIFDIKIDGDHPDNFHKKCDGIPHTLCVLKTKCNRVFGGYTEAPWENSDGVLYKSDPNAFLFSLSKHSHHPVKPEKQMYATLYCPRSFCVFGEVHSTDDLFVGGWVKESKIGMTYKWADGLQADGETKSDDPKEEKEDAQPYLAVEKQFQHTAFETYKVLFY